jgi:hypothetical protein
MANLRQNTVRFREAVRGAAAWRHRWGVMGVGLLGLAAFFPFFIFNNIFSRLVAAQAAMRPYLHGWAFLQCVMDAVLLLFALTVLGACVSGIQKTLGCGGRAPGFTWTALWRGYLRSAPATLLLGGIPLAVFLLFAACQTFRIGDAGDSLLGAWKTLVMLLRRDAVNGELRLFFALGTNWILFCVSILCTACAAFLSFCAVTYRFKRRFLLLTLVTLLQILILIPGYTAVSQFAAALSAKLSATLLEFIWVAVYLLTLLWLCRRFAKLRPATLRNQHTGDAAFFMGHRMFLYYAAPRARLQLLFLFALSTVYNWNDMFWNLRRFRLRGTSLRVLGRGAAWWEWLIAVFCIVCAAAVSVFIFIKTIKRRETYAGSNRRHPGERGD